MTSSTAPKLRKSFSFTGAEAYALVQSSLGHDHDPHVAKRAREKMIDWLLTLRERGIDFEP